MYLRLQRSTVHIVLGRLQRFALTVADFSQTKNEFCLLVHKVTKTNNKPSPKQHRSVWVYFLTSPLLFLTDMVVKYTESRWLKRANFLHSKCHDQVVRQLQHTPQKKLPQSEFSSVLLSGRNQFYSNICLWLNNLNHDSTFPTEGILLNTCLSFHSTNCSVQEEISIFHHVKRFPQDATHIIMSLLNNTVCTDYMQPILTCFERLYIVKYCTLQS